MNRSDHIRLMANYNGWMNGKIYHAVRALPVADIFADKRAFFGSLYATLRHITGGDMIWLKRFATHPAGYPALDPLPQLPPQERGEQPGMADFHQLMQHREALDRSIIAWARAVEDSALDYVMHYTNSRGEVSDKDFFGLVMHFFNHQTHHRGQVTTLLSQLGVDIGDTDLLVLIPDQVAR